MAFRNFQPVVTQGQKAMFSPTLHPHGACNLLQKLRATGLTQDGPRDCPVSPGLQHCQQILYRLSHQGSL